MTLYELSAGSTSHLSFTLITLGDLKLQRISNSNSHCYKGTFINNFYASISLFIYFKEQTIYRTIISYNLKYIIFMSSNYIFIYMWPQLLESRGSIVPYEIKLFIKDTYTH